MNLKFSILMLLVIGCKTSNSNMKAAQGVDISEAKLESLTNHGTDLETRAEKIKAINWGFSNLVLPAENSGLTDDGIYDEVHAYTKGNRKVFIELNREIPKLNAAIVEIKRLLQDGQVVNDPNQLRVRPKPTPQFLTENIIKPLTKAKTQLVELKRVGQRLNREAFAIGDKIGSPVSKLRNLQALKTRSANQAQGVDSGYDEYSDRIQRQIHIISEAVAVIKAWEFQLAPGKFKRTVMINPYCAGGTFQIPYNSADASNFRQKCEINYLDSIAAKTVKNSWLTANIDMANKFTEGDYTNARNNPAFNLEPAGFETPNSNRTPEVFHRGLSLSVKSEMGVFVLRHTTSSQQVKAEAARKHQVINKYFQRTCLEKGKELADAQNRDRNKTNKVVAFYCEKPQIVEFRPFDPNNRNQPRFRATGKIHKVIADFQGQHGIMDEFYDEFQ